MLESLLGGSTTAPSMPGQIGGTVGIGASPAVGVNFTQTTTNIPPLAAPLPGSTSVPLVNAQQQPGLTTILPAPAPTATPNLVTGKGLHTVLH